MGNLIRHGNIMRGTKGTAAASTERKNGTPVNTGSNSVLERSPFTPNHLWAAIVEERKEKIHLRELEVLRRSTEGAGEHFGEEGDIWSKNLAQNGQTILFRPRFRVTPLREKANVTRHVLFGPRIQSRLNYNIGRATGRHSG